MVASTKSDNKASQYGIIVQSPPKFIIKSVSAIANIASVIYFTATTTTTTTPVDI
jgi:hypothetical protein